MAEIVTCIITTSEDGKGAYGVRADTDAPVYFPVRMSEEMELEEFDSVEAVLVANDHPATPWRACRARRLEEAA